jgi:anaerobic magnesium-protoporphyrin IX monomethyl ester cyclase
MKLLLIIPPAKHTVVTDTPNEVYEEFGAYPPLGLMYLASAVRKFSGLRHDVKILDCDTDKLGFGDLKKEIISYKPDIVGATAYTPIIYDAWQSLRLAKRIDKNIITLLGGHHSDIYPEETIRLGDIDFIIQGEAEYILPRFLDTLEKKGDLKKLKGLVFIEKSRVIKTGGFGYVNHLDKLPLPARDLVDWKKHQCVLGKENVVATMMSSRGCPYRCTFCYKPLKSRAWRFRSAENIISELEQCLSLGISEIFFFDDNFSVDTRRVEAICEAIIKKRIRISWSFRGRVDTLSYGMLALCRKAGCHRIHFGVETSTDAGLRELKKDITTNQIRKAFALCKKAGIVSVANLIIGLPGQKKEDMLKTVEFANSIGADYAEFQVMTPYPKTELYEEGLRRGIFKRDFWREYAKKPSPGFRLRVWNEHYTREQLFGILAQCLRRFYLNPRRIFRIGGSIRSLKELKTKLRSGLSLIYSKI